MPIVKLDTTTSAAKWTNKFWFEKGSYKALIKDERNYISDNSGNFVKQLDWEIYHPEPMVVGDKPLDIDGVEFTTYWAIRKVNPETKEWDDEASKQAQADFQSKVLEKLGIDVSEGWDSENPPSLKGKFCWVNLYAKKNTPMVKDPNDPKKKVPQKDPITGKDLITYDIQMEFTTPIFGLVDEEPHRPF